MGKHLIKNSETLTFFLICLVSGILVCCHIPTHIWRDNDELNISFVLGPKNSIDIQDSSILPASFGVVASLQRINGLEAGNKRSGIWEDINTGKRYYYYAIGKGESVMFESGGKTFITDGYYTNGYPTKKRLTMLHKQK